MKDKLPKTTSYTDRSYKDLYDMEQLSINDLKKIAIKKTIGTVPTKGKKGWFEKFMNRIGWYRQSEWYLIDINKINVFKNW